VFSCTRLLLNTRLLLSLSVLLISVLVLVLLLFSILHFAPDAGRAQTFISAAGSVQVGALILSAIQNYQVPQSHPTPPSSRSCLALCRVPKSAVPEGVYARTARAKSLLHSHRLGITRHGHQFVQEDFTLLFKQDQTAEAALQGVVAGTMVRAREANLLCDCPRNELIRCMVPDSKKKIVWVFALCLRPTLSPS
jgi:hypothetical protein